MDRRLAGVTAVATALLVGAAWWWWRSPLQDPALVVTPEPDQAPLKRLHRVAPPLAETSVPPSPVGVEVPVAPPTPREAALQILSELGGEGLIRCPVGDMVPEGPAQGLSHAVVEQGLLLGTVVEAEGNARIHAPGDTPSDPPRAVVRWTGAWPGEQGHCEVLVPELVQVAGWVTDAAGLPVTGGQVGNAVDGTWPIDADGAFLVECWRGTRCPLAARSRVGQGWGAFVPVVPDGPTWGVELVLEPEPQQELVAYLEGQVAENERLARMLDPLTLALQHPELPEQARPLLEAWKAEEAAERAGAAALLAELR